MANTIPIPVRRFTRYTISVGSLTGRRLSATHKVPVSLFQRLENRSYLMLNCRSHLTCFLFRGPVGLDDGFDIGDCLTELLLERLGGGLDVGR